MWLPMHDEEWDGDLPIGTVGLDGDKNGAKEEPIPMSGEVVFSGDKLPWSIRRHEVCMGLYCCLANKHRKEMVWVLDVNGR